MIELKANDLSKVLPLVKSRNELSVLSVINGTMPGEVYVNSFDNPTAALIKTSDCNLIAGSSSDAAFNSEVSGELDFYEQLTPDSKEWLDIIPAVHKNPFIRKYKRRHYSLSMEDFKECIYPLKEGFVIEKVDLDLLKQKNYENTEKLLDWIDNWGEAAQFQRYGTGYFIHNNKVIVSWSLSDCSYDKKIAIGIHTDERYRNNGFGIFVVSATVKDCFAKGYQEIDWLCVDTNKGSIAIAERLGFQYRNHYDSFSSYPPIENVMDLSEAEWSDWGNYLERASRAEDCLLWDAMYCYIKSNDVNHTIRIMTIMEQRKITPNYTDINNFINYLQGYGLLSNFKSQVWIDFLNKKVPC